MRMVSMNETRMQRSHSLKVLAGLSLIFSQFYATTAAALDAPANLRIIATPPADCARQVWENLEACGWPGLTNTGYPANQAFTNTNGRTITADNTVIDGEKITGRLTINAKNVAIRNSWIISNSASGSSGNSGTNGTGVIKILKGASATIDRVTIDGGNNTHACIWHEGASMVVRYVNCSRVNDGIFSWTSMSTPGQGDNFTIEESYIHTLTEATGNGHIDGYQTEGAINGTIRHNTIAIDRGQNAAISIWNSYKSSDNILVENNLLAGGGFTVYAEDYSPSEQSPGGGYTVTNIRFENNKFSNRFFPCVGNYGVWFFRSNLLYKGGPTDGWKRNGNVVLETGQNIDANNPIINGVECR